MQPLKSQMRPKLCTSSVLGKILFSLVWSALFCCLSVCFSVAQVSARLSGAITDPSGAAVSGAAVTEKSLDTGISRTASTDSSGRYTFFALPVGLYEVRVTKDGFAEGIRSGIRLAVGQDASADLTLRVGKVSEQVKVTEDAPVVSLTTQDISGLVGERQVKDLPLNGRSYDLLLALNPGFVNFTWEKSGGRASRIPRPATILLYPGIAHSRIFSRWTVWNLRARRKTTCSPAAA